jgi:hypothetical protein
MRQQVFDETKLTVSAGIAANKVCLKPFPYLITDFHRCNFRCSLKYAFHPPVNRTHFHYTRSVTQICSDKVRMILLFSRRFPDTSSPFALE